MATDFNPFVYTPEQQREFVLLHLKRWADDPDVRLVHDALANGAPLKYLSTAVGKMFAPTGDPVHTFSTVIEGAGVEFFVIEDGKVE